MSRVVHFEIHAENPERAVQFYQELLGWEFTRWEGPMDYWLVTTGTDEEPGINGGLMERRGPGPEEGQAVNSFVCTADVSDLDSLIPRVEELGGTLAVPKNAVPGVGWLAYAKDPEGNLLGLMEADPDAR
ncbi:MAG: VOC family protein [Longimicrobiales bacterium]|nr:VOC family protein [Longimicrobiales bacterium]